MTGDVVKLTMNRRRKDPRPDVFAANSYGYWRIGLRRTVDGIAHLRWIASAETKETMELLYPMIAALPDDKLEELWLSVPVNGTPAA